MRTFCRDGLGLSRWCVVGAGALLLVACAEDNERLPNPCGAERCDIRERACQEAVVEVVRCFRGGRAVMPDIDIVTEEEYLDLTEPSEFSEEALTRLRRWNRGMSLFQLAPDDFDLGEVRREVAEEIAAAYFPDDERIVVLDRGKPLDSEEVIATFAHELVHALQDREFGLHEFYEGIGSSLDQLLAARALVEGEATHYDVLVYAALQGVQPSFINWVGMYQQWQQATLRSAYQDESPLAMSFVRFPYAFGGYYVTAEWGSGGQRAVRELFEDPPRSTADVLALAPLSEADRADAETFREVAALTAPEGFELVAYDELGSFILDNFLHRIEFTRTPVIDSRVLDLIADGVSVLFDEELDQVVVAWRMRFFDERMPSAADLSKLRAALSAVAEDELDTAQDPRARVLLDERDLIVLVSDGALPAELIGEELAWESAPQPMEHAEDGEATGMAGRWPAARAAHNHRCDH